MCYTPITQYANVPTGENLPIHHCTYHLNSRLNEKVKVL